MEEFDKIKLACYVRYVNQKFKEKQDECITKITRKYQLKAEMLASTKSLTSEQLEFQQEINSIDEQLGGVLEEGLKYYSEKMNKNKEEQLRLIWNLWPDIEKISHLDDAEHIIENLEKLRSALINYEKISNAHLYEQFKFLLNINAIHYNKKDPKSEWKISLAKDIGLLELVEKMMDYQFDTIPHDTAADDMKSLTALIYLQQNFRLLQNRNRSIYFSYENVNLQLIIEKVMTGINERRLLSLPKELIKFVESKLKIKLLQPSTTPLPMITSLLSKLGIITNSNSGNLDQKNVKKLPITAESATIPVATNEKTINYKVGQNGEKEGGNVQGSKELKPTRWY